MARVVTLMSVGVASLAGALAALRTASPARPVALAPPHVVPARTRVAAPRAVVASPPAPLSPAVPSQAHATLRRVEGGGWPLRCGSLRTPDARGHFVARSDLQPPLGAVDGDDLLALVDRSARFALSPTYAPTDLVDVATMRPAAAADCEPPGGQCLRREAAVALRAMTAAMREHGTPAMIHSAFRAYDAQCGVFRRWSVGESQGMCVASTASALAGHSQHQLGTALDLFTEQWAQGGPVMRAGFGCTPGARWLAEHAWEYGYVLPYPLPMDERAEGSQCARREGARDEIDPRTGYRYEPWHLRYVGAEAARSFHAAWRASGPGSDGELTLGQWLRSRVGIDGDADLPVCDGCACGACTTFAAGGAEPTPCGGRALVLGVDGAPVSPARAPEIEAAEAVSDGDFTRVTVTLRVAEHTTTQTPIRPEARPPERYGALRGAWRVSVENTAPDGVSLRAAIWSGEAGRLDGANTLLPAPEGTVRVTVNLPRAARVRVGLAHENTVEQTREVIPRGG